MHRSRLGLFATTFLGACAGDPVLDDEACLSVDLGSPCPDAQSAADQLVGDQTCSSPVREITATGDLISQSDVLPTGYGGYETYTPGGTQTGQPETQCCYEAAYVTHRNQSCIPGRPLTVGGRAVTAPCVERGDWRADLAPSLALAPEERACLAEEWARAAAAEHASIAAFARVSLDLLAVGAPPDLVARVARAAGDEVHHAKAAFALASAYAGRSVGPAALTVPSRRRVTLRQLAVETFREGCVGESLAVGLALAQLRSATDPVVRGVLRALIADEQRHAELAWDILAWALSAGGAPVREAVNRAARRLSVPSPAESLLAPPALVDEALRGVIDQVVRPTVAELLAA